MFDDIFIIMICEVMTKRKIKSEKINFKTFEVIFFILCVQKAELSILPHSKSGKFSQLKLKLIIV